jgi:acetyl-CoA C-acetyltransferase
VGIVDGRAPVLVGVGQCTPADRTAPTSPLELMTAAASRALHGFRPELVDSVGVTNCITWAARDPGRALAASLGLAPKETVTTRVSGTSPLDLLRDACTRIAAGSLRAALLAGGEAVKAVRDGRCAGGPEGSAEPSRVLGVDRTPTHPGEEAAGLFRPVQFYPMFENALRAAAGRSVRDHQVWLGELWSRFAEVARTNPYAWITEPPVPVTEIGSPNRPVCFPYPKLMTANLGVDQAAAVLVCSAQAAREAGIPYDRWVFVHATAAANDHWHVGERAALDRSPAINAIGRALFGHTRVDPAELTRLDLYSCFPSAVQIAAAELGIDLANPAVPPTVTGGLTFAGGPGSNYVMHSMAAMASRLREDPDGVGLCTGVGWFLTKHAAAILSPRPPAAPFADLDVQSEVDALPRRAVAVGETGPATVETYTVTYDYERRPLAAFVAALLPDGRRAFATSTDRALAAHLLDRDPIGTVITLLPDAGF